MKVRWARGATRQLLAAHAYVAADNPRAADKLLLRITQTVRHLAVHPRAGREGRVKDTRELVIVGTPYIVAYRISRERELQVLTVLHGKRRWPDSF